MSSIGSGDCSSAECEGQEISNSISISNLPARVSVAMADDSTGVRVRLARSVVRGLSHMGRMRGARLRECFVGLGL